MDSSSDSAARAPGDRSTAGFTSPSKASRFRDDEVRCRPSTVVEAAGPPDVLSVRVSDRRAIPNSLGGSEHAAYRSLVDRFLSSRRVAGLEPRIGRPGRPGRLVAVRGSGRRGRCARGPVRGTGALSAAGLVTRTGAGADRVDIQESVPGRPLSDSDVVSILRNWTTGDLGSLALSASVIVAFLAARLCDPDRHASANLVFGSGPYTCPDARSR